MLANHISTCDTLPDDFVELSVVCPDIQQDIKYATHHNFVGRPIPGYEAPKALMTHAAASALKKVQEQLEPFGLGLKVYDAYRPQRAAEYFYNWSQDMDDQGTKTEFYPDLDKRLVFEEGYLMRHSTHNRGSTVDLTIVPLRSKIPQGWTPGDTVLDGRAPMEDRWPDNSIDMGTGFDCLDTLSHTFNPALPAHVRAHRMLLRRLMEDAGFRGINAEWWHFTLSDEPYPDTYFDVPIS